MTRLLLTFVVLVGLSSCHQPMPPVTSPLVVRTPDLVGDYRADPSAADLAFTGQPVHVSLSNYVRRGNELHWHIADPNSPAVCVFQFDSLPKTLSPSVWIIGVCSGMIRDEHVREFHGYNFHVVISGCRLAPPPDKRQP